jgi:hypothetical protein
MKKCLYCLKKFKPNKKKQNYCTTECASKKNLELARKMRKRTGKVLNCLVCLKEFYVELWRFKRYNVQYCSRKCTGTARLNQLWADPNFLLNKAANLKLPYHKYVYIKIDGKRIREHRYIMEQFIGRKLLKNEHVHHKDGNGLNNDINNLELLTNSEHQKKEWLFKKSLIDSEARKAAKRK